MKKVFALLLTFALAITACTMVASAATPSAELKNLIKGISSAKDKNGISVDLKLDDIDGSTEAFTTAFEELKKTNSNLKINDYKKIYKVGNAEIAFPVTVELSVPGIKGTDQGYILLKKANGSIEKITPTLADGKLTVDFNELGEFVFVYATVSSAGEEKPSSPQTSDTTTPIALTLLVAGAAVAAISVKKIKTAA